MALTSITYWKYLREQSISSHHSLDITRTQYFFVFSELFRGYPRSAITEYMKHSNVFTQRYSADDVSRGDHACAQARRNAL